MTAKRFINKGKDILQYGEWWCSANGEHCADVIATAINELIKENEQLKHQLSQQEMEYVTDCHRLAEENMQLQEELDYYKTKCGSLETALLQGRRAVDKEKEQRMFFVDMEKQRKMFR